MSTLTFADTHNMVAFLEKPAESDGFHEIIDFLNANQIRYALTVNPTIYTSCIQQFWATAKAKTVNGGTDCLPTATIFEELARMGAKSTAWNEFSSTMASLIICLSINQKFNMSKYIFDAMLGDMSHHKKIYVNPSHIKKIFANMRRKGKDFSRRITPLFETMMVQPNQEEGVDSGIPIDSQQTPITTQPSSSKSQKKQSRRKKRQDTIVLDLEKAKDAQTKEIAALKKRGRSNNEEMFDINDLHSDEVNVDMPVCDKQEQSAKERETLIQIKAAKPKVVTTAATTTTTTTRPKARGVIVQEPSEFRTPQVSQPSMIKDKGKAIMIEPEVPLKRKDQVALDEDLERNLQAQLEAELIEEEMLARKKEEETNIALIESWDNIQAMMEVDFELAQRLQTEEQGEITIEKRSRLFVELMNKRKKHFAMLRAEEKRRKPLTKAQNRNLMSTYLKNIDGYKHN
ncbi:hypothetical protein Tco_1358816 [Tanacetum coccineum]